MGAMERPLFFRGFVSLFAPLLVAAVDRAAVPVVNDVVDEVEIAVHSDAWVPPGVAGEQVVVERAVLAAPGPAEGVLVQVQRLAGD